MPICFSCIKFDKCTLLIVEYHLTLFSRDQFYGMRGKSVLFRNRILTTAPGQIQFNLYGLQEKL